MSQSTSALKSVLARHDVSAEPTHTGVVMGRSQIACGLVIALVGLYASVRASAKEILDSPQAAIPSSGPQPIVLAWPTIDGQHGLLDSPFTLRRAAGRTVLETLTSLWELCQKDGPDPTNDGFFRHIVNGALPPRKSRELYAARDHLRPGGLDRYAGIEPPERLHSRDVWLFNLASERCPHGNTRILPGRTISS